MSVLQRKTTKKSNICQTKENQLHISVNTSAAKSVCLDNKRFRRNELKIGRS